VPHGFVELVSCAAVWWERRCSKLCCAFFVMACDESARVPAARVSCSMQCAPCSMCALLDALHALQP
jgi:hypothetical protein